MKITAILPCYNLIKGHFPFAEVIALMLPLVDELIIAEGGSRDGTKEAVKAMARLDKRIKVIHTRHFDCRNWESLDEAMHVALDQATGDWIIQMQADEFFHPKDHQLWRDLILSAELGNYNSIVCNRVDFTSYSRLSPESSKSVVRIFRKSPNIRSTNGGDTLYFRGMERSVGLIPQREVTEVMLYHMRPMTTAESILRAKAQRDHYEYAVWKSEAKFTFQTLQRILNVKDDLSDLKIISYDETHSDNKFSYHEKLPEIFHGLSSQTSYVVRNSTLDAIKNGI